MKYPPPLRLAQDMIEGKARGTNLAKFYMLRILVAMCKSLKANFRKAKYTCKEEGWGVLNKI